MNSGYIGIDTYHKEIITKSKEYHKSKLVKSIKKLVIGKGREGDIISCEQLICILLYTDYTKLSFDFSRTFRKLSIYEPVQSIKNRNANYWWWSKGLKEVIQYYGQSNYRYGGVGQLSLLKGPFFSGLSSKLKIPSFNIHLYGPVSTSIHIECATKFSGTDGIIITLNNNKGLSMDTKGFDVSFLSRYGGEEAERYTLSLLVLFIILIQNI